MPDLVTSFHMVLPAVESGKPAPEWIHLLPAGTFSGVDGRGPYVADAAAVVAASQSGLPLVIDENHATDFALTSGQEAPGRAWIVELQARQDGVWGRTDWTKAGAALMADRAYRFISPVFQHRKADGRVGPILRAALTNAPNLQLTSLHTQGHGMDLITQLRQAYGLPDTADEAAVVAKATATATAVAAHSQQLAAIAKAAGLAETLAPEALVTALQTRGAGKGSLEEVVALQTQVNTLQATISKDRAIVVIDKAMAAGKPIPAARRDDFIARHMADPTGTEAWLADMPSLHSGGLGNRGANPPAGADAGFDADEAKIIAMMGLDPVKYKAVKAEIETSRGVRA
jgi:phage I-like protein